MPVIISKTSAICNRCFSPHPAEFVRHGDRVDAVVHCPEGDILHEISSDADLFMKFRATSATDLSSTEKPQGIRPILNYLSITNACNLNCMVCGAAAKQGAANAVFLSVDEICRRAKEAHRQGGRILHLFGGEPTLHPQLLEIVNKLHQMGFSLGLVTNGLRLGTENLLAPELKKSGLSRICLQFDSFDISTLEKFGRNHLDEKRKAISNAISAGLSIGLNCTVTRHNLHEIGDLLAHGMECGIPVRNMTFASAAPVGRYKLPPQEFTDREQIIRQLLTIGERYGFSEDDILPLPAYLPWGIQNHPDCGAHILFVRTPEGIVALNRLIDLHIIYKRMGSNRLRPGFAATYLLPAWFIIRAVKKGKWRSSLRIAAGLLLAKKHFGLLNVGISNYRGAVFIDEQRLSRCSSVFHTSVGPIKGCIHFCGNPAAPGSKTYEECHGSC